MRQKGRKRKRGEEIGQRGRKRGGEMGQRGRKGEGEWGNEEGREKRRE